MVRGWCTIQCVLIIVVNPSRQSESQTLFLSKKAQILTVTIALKYGLQH